MRTSPGRGSGSRPVFFTIHFGNAVVVENRLAVLVQFGFERGVPVLVENRFAVLVHLGDVFGDVLVRIPLRPPRARVVGALPRGAVRGAARDVSVGVQNLDGAVGEVPRRRAVGKHDATRLLRETRRVQNRPAPAPGGVRSARGDALHHAPLGGDRDAQTRRRGVLREDWFTRRGLGLGRRLVRRVSLLVQHGLAVLAQHGHGRRLLHHPSRGAVVVENRLAVLVQFGFERGVPVLVENRFAVLVHLGFVLGFRFGVGGRARDDDGRARIVPERRHDTRAA